MKTYAKINSIFLAYFLFFTMSIFLADAGEWRKKPFKDVYGNDQYEYEEDGYKVNVNKKPFPNTYGQDEYEIEDNQGNAGVLRRKPFTDAYGNPVYEDTFTRKEKKEEALNPGEESKISPNETFLYSETILNRLIPEGAVPAGVRPKTILEPGGEPGYYQTDPLSNAVRGLEKFQQEQQKKEERKQETLKNQTAIYQSLIEAGYDQQTAYEAAIKNEFLPPPQLKRKSIAPNNENVEFIPEDDNLDEGIRSIPDDEIDEQQKK
ncbi:MAG: hypothetical protein HZA28_08895 [Candidatus Omnitrophica bacterium]|nr:hypothetical protein [Candidatus Omnitrophota bacterium]